MPQGRQVLAERLLELVARMHASWLQLQDASSLIGSARLPHFKPCHQYGLLSSAIIVQISSAAPLPKKPVRSNLLHSLHGMGIVQLLVVVTVFCIGLIQVYRYWRLNQKYRKLLQEQACGEPAIAPNKLPGGIDRLWKFSKRDPHGKPHSPLS